MLFLPLDRLAVGTNTPRDDRDIPDPTKKTLDEYRDEPRGVAEQTRARRMMQDPSDRGMRGAARRSRGDDLEDGPTDPNPHEGRAWGAKGDQLGGTNGRMHFNSAIKTPMVANLALFSHQCSVKLSKAAQGGRGSFSLDVARLSRRLWGRVRDVLERWIMESKDDGRRHTGLWLALAFRNTAFLNNGQRKVAEANGITRGALYDVHDTSYSLEQAARGRADALRSDSSEASTLRSIVKRLGDLDDLISRLADFLFKAAKTCYTTGFLYTEAMHILNEIMESVAMIEDDVKELEGSGPSPPRPRDHGPGDRNSGGGGTSGLAQPLLAPAASS